MCVHTLYTCVYIHIDKAYIPGMCACTIYMEYIYINIQYTHIYVYVRVVWGSVSVYVCACVWQLVT